MNLAKSILTKLVYTIATIAMLSWLIKFWWIGSGSNEWELAIDKDGIQVYTLKTPGHYITQTKTVMKGEYRLSQLAAAFLLDNASLENCQQWIPECVDDVVIEPYKESEQGDSILWTLDVAPGVFQKREFLIRNYVMQDPDTGIVKVDILAATNKAERNDCCIRITQIHNHWEFKSLGNGQVELSLIQDASMGGLFPDFLVNLAGAEEAWKLFKEKVPTLMNKEKYKNASFSFIREPV